MPANTVSGPAVWPKERLVPDPRFGKGAADWIAHTRRFREQRFDALAGYLEGFEDN